MHLRLSSVSHRYRQSRKDVHALDDVSLDVSDGELMVIVGASGCGKSTLLRLVAGLMAPTEGVIDRAAELESGDSIGMVFQRPVLMPWRSVMRNILLPAEVVKGYDGSRAAAKAAELIRQTGLEGFEASYPHQLSGGMQQRVAICRSLLLDPPVLLMDEPFGALDAITRERLNILLQKIWADTGKTILLVTHNIEEAVFLADRVVVMSPRPGRVVEVLENPLPRPRDSRSFQDPRFTELSTHIRSLIVDPEP